MAGKTTEDIFKEFYPKLLEILPVECLIIQFFSKELISSAEKDKLEAFSSDKEKAKYFLNKVIEPGLKIGYMDQFDEMLAVMENSNDRSPVKFLATEMKKLLKSPTVDLNFPRQTRLKDTETLNEECVDDYPNYTNASVAKYPVVEIHKAYHRLTRNITDILVAEDFKKLRRACYQEIAAPSSTLPKSLVQELKPTKTLDDMLDVLALSPYWNWFDTRLLQALVSASGSPEAEMMLEQFKQIHYAHKVSEVLPCVIVRPTDDKIIFTEKFNKDPKELTLLDLLKHKQILEYEVMDIGENKIILNCIRTGCVELRWLVSSDLVHHAYTSIKKNQDKLSSLSVESLICEEADEFAGLPILWRGQEVGEAGSIEPLPEHVYVIQEQCSLAQGLQWVTLSSSSDVQGLIKLDDTCSHLISFIFMYPNTKNEWQFGIRTTRGELIALVLAYALYINVGEVSLTCMDVLTCYDPKYNGKPMFYALIKEIMRRANLHNINHQLIYKHHGVLKPITTLHTWQYSFDHLASSKLPSSPRTPGWRRMTSEDVPSALALVNKWSLQFEIRQVFNSEEEFAYRFLCSVLPNSVYTYVVDNKINNITDLVSFRLVNKKDMVFSIQIVAFTQTPIKQLLIDALVCAKELDIKVLIMNNLNIKADILSSLFFYCRSPCNFSIYNYRYHETEETKVWIMM